MREEFLMQEYLKLWSERTTEHDSLEHLIKVELLDEMTHPRLRKSKHEKFYLAIKRILYSSLDEKVKLELIHYYTKIMDKL